MQPRVIVFDEPFSNLDYPGVRQVLRQMVALHRSGHTILLTTHDLDKVLAHADRLVIMQHGRIVADGLPAAVVSEAETFDVRSPLAERRGGRGLSWLN
jgi:biotin transport system ATP-binding protein